LVSQPGKAGLLDGFGGVWGQIVRLGEHQRSSFDGLGDQFKPSKNGNRTWTCFPVQTAQVG